MGFRRGQVVYAIARDAIALKELDIIYKEFRNNEMIADSQGCTFTDIAMTIVEDREGYRANGSFSNPILCTISNHRTMPGSNVRDLCRSIVAYLQEKKKLYDMDILSVCSGMEGGELKVFTMTRMYSDFDKKGVFNDIHDFLGEIDEEEEVIKDRSPFIIPENAIRTYTEEEVREHKEKLKKQKEIFDDTTRKEPFLNRITELVPEELTAVDDRAELIYDLKTKDAQTSTYSSYEKFTEVFVRCMELMNTTEKDIFYDALEKKSAMAMYEEVIDRYISENFVKTGYFPREDVPALKDKIYRSLFENYILQDLIDDPLIDDIKITAPHSIRVRVKGKAYVTNISFINDADYERYIRMLAVKNRLNLNVPTQTFTDQRDDVYDLRYTLTNSYIMSTGYPSIHIRKVRKNKRTVKELIELGMMNETVCNWMIKELRDSRGIVIAGPTGSGKTTLLNALVEEYPSSDEILVIQESDEIRVNKKGAILQHTVINPQPGQMKVTLEDLSRAALVSGANVFIIGESKGAEICDAMTLANSGCRTAITVHSNSAMDTIDKMANLAMRGYVKNEAQALRMLTSFETIIYVDKYKVTEIVKIRRYNEETGRIEFDLLYEDK